MLFEVEPSVAMTETTQQDSKLLFWKVIKTKKVVIHSRTAKLKTSEELNCEVAFAKRNARLLVKNKSKNGFKMLKTSFLANHLDYTMT